MNDIFYPLFDKYDKEALNLKFWFYQFFWLGGIGAGVAAVLVFALSTTFPEVLPANLKGFWLPILEVLLVFLSFGFLGRMAPQYKTQFLQNRNWAEYLRIQVLMATCGLDIKTDQKTHKNYSISSEIKKLEAQYTANQPNLLDLESIKAKLIDFIKAQNKYHTETVINGYKQKEHEVELALRIILYLFGFVVVAKLVFELMEYGHNHFIHEHIYLLSVCKFALIVLPPMYAALEGIFYFSEWKRNIDKSETINKKYNTLLKKIDESQTIEQVKEFSQDLNRIFWNEQYNWLEWYHHKKIEARV